MGSHPSLFHSIFMTTKTTPNQPPKLFLNFFRWFCKPELLEEIEGDLLEQYQQQVKEKGMHKANWSFVKEVILLFRPAIYGNIINRISPTLEKLGINRDTIFMILLWSIVFKADREYRSYGYILIAMTSIVLAILRLKRKKQQDDELGTNLFEKDLKGIAFRILFMTGIMLVFYLLVKS
jgi:hypothetical protein